MATIFEKLENIEARYEELTAQLSSPDVLGDSTRYQKLARTHADLSQVVAKYREWKQLETGLRETKQMLVDSEDAEIMQLAHEEDRQLTERKETVERELKRLLLPRDPNDDKNVLLEIRAGTGGDEAAFIRGGALSDVCAVCGVAGVARRGAGKLPVFAGRSERHRCGDSGRQGVLEIEI